MTTDETENISRKTWFRNIEPVNKVGYMDGATDGQVAVFQSSFDMGYKQGFSFGKQLGLRNALSQYAQSQIPLQQEANSSNDLRDPRRINCQLCVNGIPSEQNVVNLYNNQQEKNTEIIKQPLEND